MANFINNLRMSSPLLSMSSSYGIDMIALAGMSREGSKIEIPLCGKSGQGELMLEAVELRREAMRTVERTSADDVLSCGISIS